MSTPFSSKAFKSSIESDPSDDSFTPPLYSNTALGNLSNKSNYDYTDADVDKIFKAIETSLRNSKSKFSTTTYPKKKKFEF